MIARFLVFHKNEQIANGPQFSKQFHFSFFILHFSLAFKVGQLVEMIGLILPMAHISKKNRQGFRKEVIRYARSTLDVCKKTPRRLDLTNLSTQIKAINRIYFKEVYVMLKFPYGISNRLPSIFCYRARL